MYLKDPIDFLTIDLLAREDIFVALVTEYSYGEAEMMVVRSQDGSVEKFGLYKRTQNSSSASKYISK